MKFDVETLNQLINNYDGNYSSLYPHLESRVLDHIKEGNLPDGFECFLGSFMFFEYDYFLVKRDMLLHQIRDEVYDIGAQLGFQSELFLDQGYVGIEMDKDVMFNHKHPNVRYIFSLFPEPETNVAGKVVISNMSISYFDNYLNKDESKKAETEERTLNALSQAKILYFRGTPEYTVKLMQRFRHSEFLGSQDGECLEEENDKMVEQDSTPGIVIRLKKNVSAGVWKFYN